MSHSFSKLELLLTTKGFKPKNIFTIDGYCVFIEIFCVSGADTFLLYIPSQFNIKHDGPNVYKLNYVDIQNSGDNILSKYAEEPDKLNIKNNYDEVNLGDSTENNNLEQSLTENYNREILLKDLNKDDKDILKDIFRQLNRFIFCVQNLKYKLAIVYKNYISAIKKDDSIECYYINNFPYKNERNLYVSVDLKSLYEKIDNVYIDVKTIKESIFKILNQNQIKHSKILNSMLDNKDKLIYYSELVYKKKEYYEQYINELESMLKKLQENEDILMKEKTNNINNTNEYGIKGIHKDIENSHLLFQLDAKIQKNIELKEELVQDILKIRREQNNITLEIDKILFDNSIMLNEIIKNFNYITKILE